jgi:hypothetical protein
MSYTLQYIAVEADSKAHAFKKVSNFLDGKNGPTWSDEHEVGACTWKSVSGEPYPKSKKDPLANVLHTEDFLFKRAIKDAKSKRKDEMKSCVSLLSAFGGEIQYFLDAVVFIGNPNPNIGKTTQSHAIVNSVTDLLLDIWMEKSHFYDTVNYTTSFEHLEKRIIFSPNNQYLVPVMFHF